MYLDNSGEEERGKAKLNKENIEFTFSPIWYFTMVDLNYCYSIKALL